VKLGIIIAAAILVRIGSGLYSIESISSVEPDDTLKRPAICIRLKSKGWFGSERSYNPCNYEFFDSIEARDRAIEDIFFIGTGDETK